MSIVLAVDAMSGDNGLTVSIPASIDTLSTLSDLEILLVGCSQEISLHLLKVNPKILKRIKVIHASEIITMDDSIEIALRKKKQSSMRIMIEQVKKGYAAVGVSAGNTGALMAISKYILKTLDGINRPAIAAGIPNQKGKTTIMLDLGANSNCESIHLLQFAQMADIMSKIIDGNCNPLIGLLNVGKEDIKGNEIVKQANTLLSNSHLNFFGNVEGDDIFKGTTDIIICDGFVGNVVLKASEGLTAMISNMIKNEFSNSFLSRVVGLFAMPILKKFKKKIDHRSYNGAILLGLNGLILKSHGSADRLAFHAALLHAYRIAKTGLIQKIAMMNL